MAYAPLHLLRYQKTTLLSLVREREDSGDCRLTDGFQDYGPTAPTSGPPGQYVITGYDAIRPVQQYSHTLPLVLPEDLDEVQFFRKDAIGPNGSGIFCILNFHLPVSWGLGLLHLLQHHTCTDVYDSVQVGVIADFPPHSAIGTMEYNNQYNTVAQYGFVNSTLRSTTQVGIMQDLTQKEKTSTAIPRDRVLLKSEYTMF